MLQSRVIIEVRIDGEIALGWERIEKILGGCNFRKGKDLSFCRDSNS
jgi:hypothetical protein